MKKRRDKSPGLSRRQALLGMAAMGTTYSAKAAGACLLTPLSGEGPFYFDPDLVRADIRGRQVGAPLQLDMLVVRAGDCSVLENARVDIWHANAFGLYSGYEDQVGVGDISVEQAVINRDYLRGTQYTGPDGRVRFQTIYPSWYLSRTPHVHFKVFEAGRELIASQVFFPESVNREVFSTWGPYRGHAAKQDTTNDNDGFIQRNLMGVFCEIDRLEKGYLATLTIAVQV